MGRIFVYEIWGAYIQEGLLSEGYLRLRFGGLIFGRTYYRKNFCICDLGGLFSGGLIIGILQYVILNLSVLTNHFSKFNILYSLVVISLLVLQVQVNPEDLLPKLPRPKDLQPFPSTESIVRTVGYFLFHTTENDNKQRTGNSC